MPSTIRTSIFRWTRRILGGLVTLVVAALAVVYALSERRFRQTFDVTAHALTVPTDSASVARGAHLAQIRGCVGCHGMSFEGKVEMDEFMIGRLAGPNLTRGRHGPALTDADWERAVRHGVRANGKALFIMPASEHNGMSDEDLGAIAAYARSLEPNPNVPPPSRAGPVIRAMFLAGVVPVLTAEDIDHAKPHPATVVAEATPAYGGYLASMCAGCHGPGMSGGKIPGGPPDWKPAANLTPSGLGHYTEETFMVAMRTGVRPDGSKIDPQMPYELFGKMNDTELRAIHSYLRTLTPRAYGSR